MKAPWGCPGRMLQLESEDYFKIFFMKFALSKVGSVLPHKVFASRDPTATLSSTARCSRLWRTFCSSQTDPASIDILPKHLIRRLRLWRGLE